MIAARPRPTVRTLALVLCAVAALAACGGTTTTGTTAQTPTTAGATTPTAAQTPAGEPALAEQDARAVLARYVEVNNRANARLDADLLATVETGSMLAIDAADYRYRRWKDYPGDPFEAFRYDAPAFWVPAATGWPRFFVVRAKAVDVRGRTLSGPAGSLTLLVFTQERAGAPWLLEHAPVVGGVDADEIGEPALVGGLAEAVEPAGTTTPPPFAARWSQILGDAAVGDETVVGPRVQATRRKAFDALGFVQQFARRTTTPSPVRGFALRLADGGVLRFFGTTTTLTLATTGGYELTSDQAPAALAGLRATTPFTRLTATQADQFVAVVPPEGPARVVGQYAGWVGAQRR